MAYQGFWLLSSNRHLRSSVPVKRIAQQTKLTTEQVLYQYVRQHLGLIVLSGTSNSKHMEEDLALESVRLTEQQLVSIAAVPVPAHTGSDAVELLFVNQLGHELNLFWKSHKGELKPNGVVQPGQTSGVNSFHGHEFIVKQGDLLVGWFEADRGLGPSQTVLLNGTLTVRFENPSNVAWEISKFGNKQRQAVPAAGGVEVGSAVGDLWVLEGPGGASKEWEAGWEGPGVQLMQVGEAVREEL